ncbi:MAG: response regulator FixJ [Rhodospirillales bacterium]|nr:response regulator FixJ [Rhodospirillales bacterium]MDH3793421.1 response regulator FixJ [Rhodospirillales bacterium]MDH3913563.1 response regulator FixJ [Rhodospirillales bacterium]MDH3920107.1 response regulator FixJ [Rhodospirillales bacterium]MDH3966891.1 response regulator FixJ [Rhodospirillales bacterium]
MDSSTIFIVDDHEAVRDSLGALLQANGLSVEMYGCGHDFLDALNPSSHGCLLLDLRLPDISGIEVQQKLFAMGAKLRTIMISGHGDVPLAVKAMKAGAVDFIEKPCTDDVILDCVRRALELSEKAREEEATNDDMAVRLALLTPREREVLDALVGGQPNKVIAYDLGISPRTVEIHRARVMSKMEAKSLSHLVRMALAAGIDNELI